MIGLARGARLATVVLPWEGVLANGHQGKPETMRPHLERRRVLLAGENAVRDQLRPLIAGEEFAGWEVVEADGFERARFILQMEPCDVLLLDASLYRRGDTVGLSWLVEQRRTPVLFLADQDADL